MVYYWLYILLDEFVIEIIGRVQVELPNKESTEG